MVHVICCVVGCLRCRGVEVEATECVCDLAWFGDGPERAKAPL